MKYKIEDAAKNLSLLIKKVKNGDEVIITKESIPVVKIVQYSPLKEYRKIGSAKGQIWISDDFDEPLEGFNDYY